MTNATITPKHTCHGAVFCGQPRLEAERECPVCLPLAFEILSKMAFEPATNVPTGQQAYAAKLVMGWS